MLSSALAASLLIAACPPSLAGGDNSTGGVVAPAELSFGASLPPEFSICRSRVDIDDARFKVTRDGIAYVELFVGAFPYSGPPDNQHIQVGDTGGFVRASADGRSEDLVVTVDGREHVRERMSRTSMTDGAGNSMYLIVEPAEDLTADQATIAETLLDFIRPR